MDGGLSHNLEGVGGWGVISPPGHRPRTKVRNAHRKRGVNVPSRLQIGPGQASLPLWSGEEVMPPATLLLRKRGLRHIDHQYPLIHQVKEDFSFYLPV